MGAVAFFVGLILLGLVIMFKEDRDKTNICNKIYRKLVDRGRLEHLTPREWGALERYILEKWKYASEQYRKSFFGRADARKEYGDEQSDEERHCSEHEIDWSRSEPDVWGSHPIHFDDESYQKWVEQWREEMQRNRFSARFKNLLREKHVDNPDVYRRANIDRKLFSKIISKESYVPGKSTVLALAVALKLDLRETREMLRWAGYAFSDGILSDVIVLFFLERGIYDIDKINEALCKYEQKILGSTVRES
ncbi:MAG: hypothetical protein IJU76_01935 [Desulfovibrionaceae bacterium]|nr:hypothetical protein [Desulfovibrionaceae bacterium]